MQLKPIKVKYSSKLGYLVEFAAPGDASISEEDILMLLVHLRAFLSQEEMDKHFSREEQEVIQRYFLQIERKEAELMDNYAKKASLKKIQQEFRSVLDWWKLFWKEGLAKVMIQMWGWTLTTKETLPLVDQLILSAVEADTRRDVPRIESMISSIIGDPNLEDPLPETVAKVEAVFGPLNWDTLKEKGKKRYEQLQKLKENREKER